VEASKKKKRNQNFQAATLKLWPQPEHMKMKVKIKISAWKQLSHSAWLAILACSFSGVFYVISGVCLFFG